MVCQQQANVAAKRNEKVTKYQKLAFELRKRRPGYDTTIIPIVIGAFGGGMKEMLRDLERIFSERIERKRLAEKAVAEMKKPVLIEKYFQDSCNPKIKY